MVCNSLLLVLLAECFANIGFRWLRLGRLLMRVPYASFCRAVCCHFPRSLFCRHRQEHSKPSKPKTRSCPFRFPRYFPCHVNFFGVIYPYLSLYNPYITPCIPCIYMCIYTYTHAHMYIEMYSYIPVRNRELHLHSDPKP